jgi:hypothetical protein
MRKQKTLRAVTEGKYVHMKEWSLLSARSIGSRDVTEPMKRTAAVDFLRAERRCAAANPNLKSV